MKTIVYAFDTDSIDGILKVMDKYVLYGRDATITSAKYVAKKMLEQRPLYAFHDMVVREGIKIDI